MRCRRAFAFTALFATAAGLPDGRHGRSASAEYVNQPRLPLVLAVALVILGVLGGARGAGAQSLYAMEYWGGPVLETFTIYPLYYGKWSASDRDTQQSYLSSLAAYISGENAPAGTQPVIRQYGVNSASLADYTTAGADATPGALSRADVVNIITRNQNNGKLPAYGPNTLIAVFLAPGFSLVGCNGCSYHASNSNTEIWMVVPHDSGPFPEVSAHEVMEAATDPVVDDQSSWGWLTGTYEVGGSQANAEVVDQCGNSYINLSNFGITIPQLIDNTLGVTLGSPASSIPPGGFCSTTGYTSLDEIQVYGLTFSAYKTKYDSLWPQGWRLYSLQAYESGGKTLYNAVWRPGGNTYETQLYNATFSDFQTQYNTLYPLGWRIYILDAHVQGSSVVFNAVWRPGDLGETQDYETTFANYLAEYNTLWPENWRLSILQTFVLSGTPYVDAVWRHDVSAELQDYEHTYALYRSDYNKYWTEGWRLYSLQSFVQGGTTLYNAVWRPGNHGEIQVYEAPYSQFIAEYNTLWPQGWRIYILQTYVADGEVLYNAVWRQGTIDRPL